MTTPTQRYYQVTKALLIGLCCDFFGTLLAGMLLGFVMALLFMLQGLPEAELNLRMQAAASSGFWFVLGIFIGGLISIASGFVTAHLLQYEIFPWLGLMGMILALIGFVGFGQEPDFTTVILSLMTLCCVMLGGWAWKWSNAQ